MVRKLHPLQLKNISIASKQFVLLVPSLACRQAWLHEAIRKANIKTSAKAWTQARAAKEAAMQCMPPVKKEPARECRRDPVDVDTVMAGPIGMSRKSP